MEEFAERESWLRKWLKLPNSIPCANTFSRVVQAIEPTAFAECIAPHLARIGFVMEGGQIAIADKIVEKDGGYILSVKGHQGRLHDETRDQFAFALRQLNQMRDRNSAANHSILRRIALNAHNRMPFVGKKRKSLPKRELRAAHDTACLKQLLSVV